MTPKLMIVFILLANAVTSTASDINIYYSQHTKVLTLENKNTDKIKWISNPNNAAFIATGESHIVPFDGKQADREFISFFHPDPDIVDIKIHNEKLITYLEEMMKLQSKITIFLTLHVKDKDGIKIVSESFLIQKTKERK